MSIKFKLCEFRLGPEFKKKKSVKIFLSHCGIIEYGLVSK